jgi:hypothetical protein
MKRNWFAFPVVCFSLLFFAADAQSATISAASCSVADITTAINSASNGDTVKVPGGNCSWSSSVSIPSTKYITLDGGGASITRTGAAVLIHQNSSGTSRVTNFSFAGTFNYSVGGAIQTSGVPGNAPFRIDHNTITATAGGSTLIEIGNLAPGLVDHNTLNAPDNAEMIHNYGAGDPSSNAGWTVNITPGGPDFVFVEDNTFTNTDQSSANFNACSGIEAYYGARTIIRHNTFNYCQVDEHGTGGAVGVRWWEIYDNNFVIPSSGGNQCCYMALRAGTGVVFGNTKSGGTNTNGKGAIQLTEEDSGTWPLAYQIGSGINGMTNGHSSCAGGTQNSSPTYLWGTDTTTMSVSPSANVQQGRDFFLSTDQPASLQRQELGADTCSTAYNYAPYTYPHPLQGQGPQPPDGLTAQAH